MKIDFLSSHPDKIKEVSEIIYEEFVINTGSTMRYDMLPNQINRFVISSVYLLGSISPSLWAFLCSRSGVALSFIIHLENK